jgi:histidinol-phosphatase
MAQPLVDDLRLAHVLADAADSLSMEGFGKVDLAISTKPDTTLVTEYDTHIEETIRRTLRTTRSRDIVLGEEAGEQSGSIDLAERRWIIDPIDGTSNFVRGVPVWATLIGLEIAGEMVVGLVSAPALGRRWWAHAGGGAFTGKSLMSNHQIRVSNVADLQHASLSYSSLHGWEELGLQDDFLNLMGECWRTRAYGDFWSYMLVAEGAVDIAAEPELNVWDMAALDIIVREAGGGFTSLAGERGPWGGNALATNGRLHEHAMAYLGHFPDEPKGPLPDPDATPDNVRHIDFSRDLF